MGITGLVIYFGLQQFNSVYYEATENKIITVQSSKSDLEKIMDEENFKKVTILRARKVASDSKMAQEKQKHEDILNAEKTRHDSIMAQIEAENEAIRAEELALVGTTNLTSPLKP